MTGIAARGLKSAAELGALREHGDRLRYMGGCRCDLCRGANCSYEKQRAIARKAGDWNGIVSARAARDHLLALSRQGVGRRAVAAASDVAVSVLTEIKSGAKTQIRARTMRRILAVTTACASDHAHTSAKPTLKRIRELLEEGYTEAFLAKKLGMETPRIQIASPKVTVRKAHDVEVLHRQLTT